jgi:hypothetical protein
LDDDDVKVPRIVLSLCRALTEPRVGRIGKLDLSTVGPQDTNILEDPRYNGEDTEAEDVVDERWWDNIGLGLRVSVSW